VLHAAAARLDVVGQQRLGGAAQRRAHGLQAVAHHLQRRPVLGACACACVCVCVCVCVARGRQGVARVRSNMLARPCSRDAAMPITHTHTLTALRPGGPSTAESAPRTHAGRPAGTPAAFVSLV
jgi:hypothetical protein